MDDKPYIVSVVNEFLKLNERDGNTPQELVETFLMSAAENAERYGRQNDFNLLTLLLRKKQKTRANEIEIMIILTELACLDAIETSSEADKERWHNMLSKARMELKRLQLVMEGKDK